MKLIVSGLLLFSLQLRAQERADIEKLPMESIPVTIAAGPVEPNWKSAGDHFKTPTWFREAKIGMWLHWGPQAVGRDGDWYAKWIYMPKHAWGDYTRVYPHHLDRVGHPSKNGFKDMLPKWTAERWNPEKLMKLYKRAGARYVIAQGMHHDNIDLWNSKFQPWNSVNIGPHKDILRGWKNAADKEHMKFGIAFHGDYSLFWYQPAFLSDLEGPMKGVPYDARQPADPNSWWRKQGLELKDLYGIDLAADVKYPKGFAGDSTDYRMQDPLSHGIPNGNLKNNIDFARWYATKWTNRVVDAIDQFNPDFIYFDGGDSYPFCGWGTGRGYRADATPRVIAHLYNKSMKQHNGELQAMAFTKGNENPQAIAVNVESSFPGGIKTDQPWQTEVGLGEWFYRDGTFYETGMVIHQLLEAISRDGNFVVNIPLTPEGELDPGGARTLQEMADWMDVNSEGIYSCSAWYQWGEGTIRMEPGNLGRVQAATPYTAKDIRFTQNNGYLYAWLMAWPEAGEVLITALADTREIIHSVQLLGSNGKLKWMQTKEGLRIKLPKKKPGQFAYGIKIGMKQEGQKVGSRQ